MTTEHVPTDAQLKTILIGEVPIWPDLTWLSSASGRLGTMALAVEDIMGTEDERLIESVMLVVNFERQDAYRQGIAEGKRLAAVEERKRERGRARLRRAM